MVSGGPAPPAQNDGGGYELSILYSFDQCARKKSKGSAALPMERVACCYRLSY